VVKILDNNGVDLSAFPPSLVTVSAPNALAGGAVDIDCVCVQTGTFAANKVSGTVAWNDGTVPVIFAPSNGSLAIDVRRSLKPGTYSVRVDAVGYALPQETISVNFPVQVKLASQGLQHSSIVFGPILPKDSGFPNQTQWLFNTGSDLDILISSLKMLLTTAKGERLMQPDYGTNIRAAIFEPMAPGIEALIRQEIADALTKWEPRVNLDAISVSRTAEREVSVNAIFVSKLNQQVFAVLLPFNI